MIRDIMLQVGKQAPDFSIQDQDGIMHSLAQYRGKWVLLYFYPKDDTSGCTTEACGLRDNYAVLQKYVTILGVSGDTRESHKKFSEKYSLPFTLLADVDKEIIRQYGAGGLLIKRISYLINPEGIITKVYPKVIPKDHATEILHDLQKLTKKT